MRQPALTDQCAGVSSRTQSQARKAPKVTRTTRTTVMDADATEAKATVKVQRHIIDMHTISDDVGRRVVTTLKHCPAGCVYFNPAVTVACPQPTTEFFCVVNKEQARWCRQASQTFPRNARRSPSRWASGGEWISNKYARYLDRALCFTGILFIDGQFVPPPKWSKVRTGGS